MHLYDNKFLFLLILLNLWPFATAQQAASSMSAGLQRCLEPMTRLEKTVSFMYRYYESVCEKLEWAASCAQSCQAEDRGAFFQYTTFYRIHCVDFEEELEELLPCLREAAFKADVVCRERCVPKEPMDKLSAKTERQKSLCKNVECSTLCYVQELSAGCPNAKETIIRLNVRIADEMRRLTRDSDFEKLSVYCQRVHDGDYLRKRMHELTKTK
uniref:Chondroitin proteoglycan 4 domain-containing protein n=1 Tax=Globodera rostochiensis TaxID=31243 RepID=A0A914HCM2_GLORO